jgi:hypothetical protein
MIKMPNFIENESEKIFTTWFLRTDKALDDAMPNMSHINLMINFKIK